MSQLTMLTSVKRLPLKVTLVNCDSDLARPIDDEPITVIAPLTFRSPIILTGSEEK